MAFELSLIRVQPINPDALADELRAALPGLSDGFIGRADRLRLIFTAEPTAEQIAQAEAVIAAHDPAAPTAAQAERAALETVVTSEQPRAAQAYAALDATLAELTTQWTGKTAGAKADALRDGLVLLLRIVRWLAARELRRSA